jgi:ribonucleoside-diphosphate reductase alpha chain
MEFVPGYRAANAPKRAKKEPGTKQVPPSDASPQHPTPGTEKKGNGHGSRMEPDTAKPFDYGSGLESQVDSLTPAPSDTAPTPNTDAGTTVNLRLAIVADPLSQQGANLQADAPACDVCGSITVRSGTCYKCLNCGNSMGCS